MRRHLLWFLSGLGLLLVGVWAFDAARSAGDDSTSAPATSATAEHWRHVRRGVGQHHLHRQRVRVTREKVAPRERTHIRIAYRARGWTLPELFEVVSRQSGTPILHEAELLTASVRIELVGSLRVPRERLFEWLQAVLSFYGYVLVPVGEGQRQWFCFQPL